MCGRFAITTVRFNRIEDPRQHIPGGPHDGTRELVEMRWGLVPHWSKEPKTPYSTSTPADRCIAAAAWSGMYHHKDPESLNLDTVRGYIEHYRFRFPVAVDPDWQTLPRWWLDGHERSWTRRLCRPST